MKSLRICWYSQDQISRALQMMHSHHWLRSSLLALFVSSICPMWCQASSRGMTLPASTYSTTWPCIITIRIKFPLNERSLTILTCTLSRRLLMDMDMDNRYQGVSMGATIKMDRVSGSRQVVAGLPFKPRVLQGVCKAACKWLAAVITNLVAIIRHLTTKRASVTNWGLDRNPTTRSSCRVSLTLRTRTPMRVFSFWTRGSF